jgi:hypothetical protein
MFVRVPAEGSPLEAFCQLFGWPGYLVPYGWGCSGIWILMHKGYVRLCRHCLHAGACRH